ncbi:MAG TPA: PLP-dependent aspartate aminotransferase family protein [Polyangia bacterium]|jgi:methionine-gamma-lyase|nr:PLP-dependent aspartate aminotransferase family protein [Polyangia bacterium]
MGADGLAKPPPAPPEPGLATRAAHVAREGSPLGPYGERPASPALYQTSNYVYDDAAGAARAAGGESYIYTRHGNPTTDAFARAVAELEGAEGGLAFASGMAAVTTALLAASGGGEVLASEGIYGGTTDFLTGLGPRLGVRARFAPAWDADAVAAAIAPETKVLLVETISNPLLRVADIPALSAIARARGLTFIVDSTFTTPCLTRPLARGADLVVHSASKYLAGHGDVIGGVVVGGKRALEPLAKVRTALGGTMDPFAAWLALRGVRTLPLRVERQCASAARLAAVLASLPDVLAVHHPSLPHHPDHARARAQLAAGGAMITIQLRDGAAAQRFYDRVRVFTRAASFGEVVSLVTHPASFSHGALPPEERARLGIDEGLLRLSVGIEDAGDLEADLRQALS